jgi:hypothetical protein
MSLKQRATMLLCRLVQWPDDTHEGRRSNTSRPTRTTRAEDTVMGLLDVHNLICVAHLH